MQPTEDERVLAALSHASIVANVVNLAGMIATALIWTMQRERSRYVSAHALQALVYQGIVLLISVFLIMAWGVCLVLSLLPAMLRPDLFRGSPPDSFWLALLGLVVPLGFGVVATLYGLYGALQAYRGQPFLYPLAGRLARRDLMPAPAVRTQPQAPAAGIYQAPAAPPPTEPSASVAEQGTQAGEAANQGPGRDERASG
jgi:uncharacterized Tic20 family protein